MWVTFLVNWLRGPITHIFHGMDSTAHCELTLVLLNLCMNNRIDRSLIHVYIVNVQERMMASLRLCNRIRWLTGRPHELQICQIKIF